MVAFSAFSFFFKYRTTSVCENYRLFLFKYNVYLNSKKSCIFNDATHHGIPCNQLFFSSLEDTILPENPVRFIDAFVEALSLQTLGFLFKPLKVALALILKSF
jgi:hypothetical protein